ncbi:MAG TPA: glutamate--tRNA ligase, partial [Candidatus Omnitrophota bacterium]|nr:glutamate--tRNA ligase [Candidatus Omnitrophota bacterium]
YLLRLGWSHGDDEIIATEQAIEWFNLDSVGRSPSRFDFVKLTNLNGHYMRQADDARLAELALPFVEKAAGLTVDDAGKALLRAGMTGLKERSKTLIELAEQAAFYVRKRPLALDEKAAKQLDADGKAVLSAFAARIRGAEPWSKETLEEAARVYAEESGLKLGKIAQPLRAALTGSSVSPPIFEVMEVLGRAETLGRIDDTGI